MSLPGINDIQWKIEQASDNTVPIVPPVSGSFKYLRASRLSPGACGLTAIKSPEVTVSVGDKFTFSYWMQSRYHGFNNILVSLAVEEDNEFVSYTIIQVYWVNEDGEMELLPNGSLWNDSNIQNDNWKSFEAELPINRESGEVVTMASSDVNQLRITCQRLLSQFTIYGICGPNEEDAVAIDNIAVLADSLTTTTEIISSIEIGMKIMQVFFNFFVC